FYRLVPDLTSRIAIVGTFVALLELCKRQVIRVFQEEEDGEIMIALTSVAIDLDSLSSEFDGETLAELDKTANG
ncbi:MAG: hypothetical protein D6719_07400, partial [Candidatus Dadabacteria bacterium]